MSTLGIGPLFCDTKPRKDAWPLPCRNRRCGADGLGLHGSVRHASSPSVRLARLVPRRAPVRKLWRCAIATGMQTSGWIRVQRPQGRWETEQQVLGFRYSATACCRRPPRCAHRASARRQAPRAELPRIREVREGTTLWWKDETRRAVVGPECCSGGCCSVPRCVACVLRVSRSALRPRRLVPRMPW